jgi:transcriptional regulator with XRE-family HTH domain
VPNFNKNKRSPELVSLGATIRSLRTSEDLTQEALANLADLDTSYLGRVERGDNNAAYLTILKIATALGMQTSQLLASAEQLQRLNQK